MSDKTFYESHHFYSEKCSQKNLEKSFFKERE